MSKLSPQPFIMWITLAGSFLFPLPISLLLFLLLGATPFPVCELFLIDLALVW
jgi:hypothetical protein